MSTPTREQGPEVAGIIGIQGQHRLEWVADFAR